MGLSVIAAAAGTGTAGGCGGLGEEEGGCALGAAGELGADAAGTGGTAGVDGCSGREGAGGAGLCAAGVGDGGVGAEGRCVAAAARFSWAMGALAGGAAGVGCRAGTAARAACAGVAGFGCAGFAGVGWPRGWVVCRGVLLCVPRWPAACAGVLDGCRCDGLGACWVGLTGRLPGAAGWVREAGVGGRAGALGRGDVSRGAGRVPNNRRRKSNSAIGTPLAGPVRDALRNGRHSGRTTGCRSAHDGRKGREGALADHLRGSGFVVSPCMARGEPWRSDALNAPPRRSTGDLLAGCGCSRPPGCLYRCRCRACQPCWPGGACREGATPSRLAAAHATLLR